MLRYQPPKSNVWGHSLRKMLPSTERQLFIEFQDRAVEKVGQKSFYLSICKLSRSGQELSSAIHEFEKLLDRSSQSCTYGDFILCEEEYERAMGLLITKERDLCNLTYYLNLSMSIEINKWRIHGQVSETLSTMSWNYGTSPHINTSLWFNCKEEFYYIQEVLSNLRVCRLNEKHLKEMKRQKKDD